jgi:hypothetical protein
MQLVAKDNSANDAGTYNVARRYILGKQLNSRRCCSLGSYHWRAKIKAFQAIKNELRVVLVFSYSSILKVVNVSCQPS